ncbi:MAG: phosphate ABC transporter permease PstA [Rhizobacter sp.]|nr:phosphate ABC transporter permease PstA [Chlorobiales bacterium]
MKKVLGVLAGGSTLLAVALILAIIVIIMSSIVSGGIGRLSWNFITTPPTEGLTEGGISTPIYGTVLLVLLMSVVGIPFGTITAVYLSEYTSERSRIARFVRFAVSNLASVPSIVFGLFGLGFFIQFVGVGMDKAFAPEGRVIFGKESLLWAAMTMAVLTLPVVIVSVEEALRNVPREYREASLALGATKWQTVTRVVLPNAVGGILTGTILAVSRGAGEVAPILFTGAAYSAQTESVTSKFMHMGYHLYILMTQSPNVRETLPVQYATTLVLLMLTFALNFTAIFVRYQFRKRLIRA